MKQFKDKTHPAVKKVSKSVQQQCQSESEELGGVRFVQKRQNLTWGFLDLCKTQGLLQNVNMQSYCVLRYPPCIFHQMLLLFVLYYPPPPPQTSSFFLLTWLFPAISPWLCLLHKRKHSCKFWKLSSCCYFKPPPPKKKRNTQRTTH